MTNPLDLPGPEFLVLYALVGAFVVYVLWMAQRGGEGGPAPRLDFSDPYRIAYLRGGAAEAARIATIALIDRGLLSHDGERVTTVPDRREPPSALESAILRACVQPQLVTQLVDAAPVVAATAPYERELIRLALLPDDATRAARRTRLLIALAILVGFSGAKLVVALGRGRTNIGFLIVLTIVFVVIAIKISRHFRTARGTALLADVRHLFRRLRERTGEFRPGQTGSDLALATAVFGVAVLPPDRFDYVKRLFPKAKASSSSSCGSSCGSGCGGGGGDGGGGGCGGCGGGGGD